MAEYADEYSDRIRYNRGSDLAALYRYLRENPYEDPVHLAAADALEAAHGGPIPDLIRSYFSGENRRQNFWYEPVENSWDGTFPYTARLGRHGPFKLYLGHEGYNFGRNDNPRWILHAISTLPGSRDFGYTFEFPHEEAHLIPQMFWQSNFHIASSPDAAEKWAQRNGADPSRFRDIEAAQFENAMDAEERRRS